MELFDDKEIQRSIAEAMSKELQPYELAIARMIKDFSGINFDEKIIIGIHRACALSEDILRKQFNGEKEY